VKSNAARAEPVLRRECAINLAAPEFQLLSPQHAVRGEIKIYLHADLSSTLQLVKFLIYWGDFNTHVLQVKKSGLLFS
jgi:hypothetical protein